MQEKTGKERTGLKKGIGALETCLKVEERSPTGRFVGKKGASRKQRT